MKQLTQEEERLVEDLERTHGALQVLDDDDVLIVFKKPKRLDYDRYVSTCAKDMGDLPKAGEALAKACVVHPDRKALDEILSEWPGLANKIAQDAAAIARKDKAEHSGKFEKRTQA